MTKKKKKKIDVWWVGTNKIKGNKSKKLYLSIFKIVV